MTFMDDFLGCLSWMTFMDDCHGFYILITDWLTDWLGWYSLGGGIMACHGWLSWMTFMDDFHGWLSWMTFMDFTYWLWTDRLKDRHCYCDWKCVTACYYLNEGYNTFLNKISLILQSKLSPIMHLLCSTITLLQTTISFKIIQTDLIYSTHTMLLLTLIKLCPF